MATCNGCGGDNAPGATRCQYCDQPLVVVRTLEMVWDVRTGAGATGRGRVALHVPTTVGSDVARTAVEAAFGAAVAALGPGADAPRVEAHMRERLPGLLPAGCSVELLSVESVSAPARSGGGFAACSLGCMTLAAALCCLPWSVFGPLMMVGTQADIDRYEQARVVTTTDAVGSQGGLVALEGVVASVGSDAPLSPDGVPCLWLSTPAEGGRREVQKVSSFRVGDLVVELDDDAQWDAPESLSHDVGGQTVHYGAIRADRPVLVIGPVAEGGGVVRGKRVFVSTRATRDEVVHHLTNVKWMGLALMILGLLVPAALAVLWFMRGRSR